MTFDEFIVRMPPYIESKCVKKIIKDIYFKTEVATWSSFIKDGKHKLLPCRCGITYRLMTAEQYDEISIINEYFQKFYIIEKKTHELEKDFEK